MGVKRFYTLIVFLLAGAVSVFAQDDYSEIFVDYRVNSTYINPQYRENAKRVENLVTFLQQIQSDTTIDVVNVCFRGAASPEGSYELNRRLAAGRLKALERIVRNYVSFPDSIVTYDDSYIPWDWLRDTVAASDFPKKQQVLDIISGESSIVKYYGGRSVDSRILRLKQLDGGAVWQQLYRRFFSRMRNACVTLLTVKRNMMPIEGIMVTETAYTFEMPDIQPFVPADTRFEISSTRSLRPFYMAAKTNLIYDALCVPNAALEFYVGKNWTIGADWMYVWWSKDRAHDYWRIYGGGLTLRKYLGYVAGQKPLQGHHLGLTAQMLTYDFELGGKGIMGGRPGGTLWDEKNWTAAAEYGYSLPLARRLNMDFSIAVGWMGGKYREYRPDRGCYVWMSTKKRNYFGPTKAEVSLVWLIGRGNHNPKKGGRR